MANPTPSEEAVAEASAMMDDPRLIMARPLDPEAFEGESGHCMLRREKAFQEVDAQLAALAAAGKVIEPASIYESAVKGRQDFRSAYRRERERVKELERILRLCVEAINPPDRSGISMHEWNRRLKAATKQANKVLPTPPGRAGE